MGKVREALGVQTRDQDDPEFFSVAGLESAAKWSAGGFTLLAGLLAFFGIKEGALDRILRAKADRALFVFVLVGLGLLCSLFAPALRAEVRIKLYSVLAPVAVLGGLASYFGRGDAPGAPNDIAFVAFALLAFAWVLFGRVRLSLVAAVLVVGVAATSMGLYSAATVAVSAKSFREFPRLVATLEESGGRDVVAVAAKAGKVDDSALVVIVNGHDRPPSEQGSTPTEIGRAILYPNGVGDVDATVRFPVAAERWPWLAVAYCTESSCRKVWGPVAVLRGRPERSKVRVGAAMSSGAAGALNVAVTVADLAPGSSVQVTVTRKRGETATRAAYAVLVGDKNGAAAWSPQVTGVPKGDSVVVSYVACDPACGPPAEAATYTV